MVIKAAELHVPETAAKVIDIDFADLKIKTGQYALAGLGSLAAEGSIINKDMLKEGVAKKFQEKMYDEAMTVVTKTW